MGANSVSFHPVAELDTNWKLGQFQWMIEGPELRSGLTLVWCLRQHWLSPLRGLVHVNGRICIGSDTPTCMGDHKSLEAGGALVEEEFKWKWLRYGALGGKKVTQSLLRHEQLLNLFFVHCWLCV